MGYVEGARTNAVPAVEAGVGQVLYINMNVHGLI